MPNPSRLHRHLRVRLVPVIRTLLALALALAPLPAAAQTGKQPSKDASARAEARRLLRAGNVAFEQGNYRAALEKFEQALAAFPSGRIHYNIGQALRQLGRPVEATVAFETFIEKADRITAQERRETGAALKELEPSVARLTVVTEPEDAEVTIDGLSRGKTPMAGPVVLGPGTHEIILGRSGYLPRRETVTLTGGVDRRVTYALAAKPDGKPEAKPAATEPPPVAAAPLPQPPIIVTPGEPIRDLGVGTSAPAREAATGGSTQRTVGLSLLGASAALAVGGGIFLAASWLRFNDARDHDCQGNCAAAANDVESHILWSKVLLGAAAVSAAAGLVVVTLAPPPGDTASAVPARGLTVVARGTF